MAGLDIEYPRAILVALAIVVSVALVVVASTSGAAFGAYNPAWDGASGLSNVAGQAGANPDLVRDTRAYRGVDPNRTVAVILSPDSAYSPDELTTVRRFVRRGGTLLVAEDFGRYGNALLEAIGADARFHGGLLRDERYHYRSPALPLARNVSAHPLMAGVDRLTLNYGTPVEGNATVLASTSAFAYIDANRDGDLDETESMQTYPVATVEAVGNGRVVAIGDPSLLINAMLDRAGNRAFVRNLFGSGERVLLDYSHTSGFPPLALAMLLLRRSPLLQLLVGVLGIGVIGAWVRGEFGRVREPFGRDPADEIRADADDLRAHLERKHPDWEDDRIERVIQGLMTGDRQSDGDE